MLVKFAPSSKPMILQSLRGRKIYRQVKIEPGNAIAEYLPMANSILQLIKDGEVIAEQNFELNQPKQIQLTATPDSDISEPADPVLVPEDDEELDELLGEETEEEDDDESPVEEEQNESATEDGGDSESESSEESDQNLL